MRLAVLLIVVGSPLAAQQFQGLGVKPPGTASAMRVYYVTDRGTGSQSNVRQMYTATRSANGDLSYGTCVVTIPRSHVLGSLEEPTMFEFSEDASKHVILQRVKPTAHQQFYTMISAQVRVAERNDAFIFIPGYNTTFHDAARRTAQIAYDLKFDGAPIVYSWPSQGMPTQYIVDETNAEWTVSHLIGFLKEFRAKSGARRIHLIAHSMGARVLTRALEDMGDGSTARFNQIILAAPDIDADPRSRPQDFEVCARLHTGG